jgi:hypothetical protein
MTTHPGGNEGFRLLEELVCQAIPDTSAVAPRGVGVAAGRGENEGMQVREELALDFTGMSGQQGGRAGEGTAAPKGTLPAGEKPSIEIVIDREFASYTPEEQERLLSALKELLIVTGEVRVVRRAPRAG